MFIIKITSIKHDTHSLIKFINTLRKQLEPFNYNITDLKYNAQISKRLSLFLLIGLSIMLRRFTSINFSNVKAQKCGRYGDDDKYIQLPAEINKDECGTGHLKAF